jgi:hypothetical protein
VAVVAAALAAAFGSTPARAQGPHRPSGFEVDQAANDKIVEQVRLELAQADKASKAFCINITKLNAIIARLEAQEGALRRLASEIDTHGYGLAHSFAQRVEAEADQVGREIARLSAVKCPPPETPPTSKPPASAPSPAVKPPPKAAPAGLTATHRTTPCLRCQPIARSLNDTADRYAAAVARNDPAEAPLRQDMARLAAALHACEARCSGGLTAKSAPSAPVKVPYRPVSPIFRAPVCPPGQTPLGPNCVTPPTPK